MSHTAQLVIAEIIGGCVGLVLAALVIIAFCRIQDALYDRKTEKIIDQFRKKARESGNFISINGVDHPVVNIDGIEIVYGVSGKELQAMASARVE